MSKRKQVVTVTAEPKIKNRAAIYLRVSTDDQASDGYGLDVQRAQCEAYAAAFGLTVVTTYSDDGISGTKPAEQRPGLARAIADAKSGQYDVLIFAAVDRLARKASLLLTLWDVFEGMDIAIVAVKERVDTSTPVGRLMRTMIAAIAEFERDTIVARTTSGRDERGKIDGEKGGRVPMGYERLSDGAIVVNQTWANVVKQVFEARKAGLTMQAIADEMNEAGIATPRGGKWYGSVVKIVLDNEPIYRGGQRGESPVHWPAILH